MMGEIALQAFGHTIARVRTGCDLSLKKHYYSKDSVQHKAAR